MRQHRPMYTDGTIDRLNEYIADGYAICQRKHDGHYEEIAIGDVILLGERMSGTQRARRSEHYGDLIVWDSIVPGESMPFRRRIERACRIAHDLPGVHISGIALAEHHAEVLYWEEDAEGIILRRPNAASHTPIIRIKHPLTIDLAVTAITTGDASDRASLCDADGEHICTIALRGWQRDDGVRVGSVVRVIAAEWTDGGSLRHPRYDRVRTDRDTADRRPV